MFHRRSSRHVIPSSSVVIEKLPNYRPPTPFLYEVAGHVENCRFGDCYYSRVDLFISVVVVVVVVVVVYRGYLFRRQAGGGRDALCGDVDERLLRVDHSPVQSCPQPRPSSNQTSLSRRNR